LDVFIVFQHQRYKTYQNYVHIFRQTAETEKESKQRWKNNETE